MTRVSRQRAIVDRGALNAELDALLRNGAAAGAQRRDALAVLKRALEDGKAEIRRRFDSAPGGGPAALGEQSFLIDQTIRAIYDLAANRVYRASNPTAGEHLCIAAVGGYGRGELAPYSDVDLLFVLPFKSTPRNEQVIEYILYMLWDLGLKVGHATRSIQDCVRLSRKDLTIRTSILEARYVWGEKRLFDQLRTRFRKEVVKGTERAFVEAKLAERDERHDRMGGSRYVLEPNVKDGKGGLRDLHTLFWIAKYLYPVREVADLVDHEVLRAGEAARFDKAHRFLSTVRCRLHYLAGRGDDRLTFDRQPEMGALLGYKDHAGARGVERFMKHYYLTAKEVGDLTGIFCAALEIEQSRRSRFALPRFNLLQRAPDGLAIENGRLALARGATFADRPIDILRLFHTSQDREIDIHPRVLRAMTRNLRLVDGLREDAEANRLFLDMLTSPKDPERVLRQLNEAGVFGRFIPDFGRVVAQMQHDMYHVFTVDEHTIMAIGILRGIEDGAFAEEMPIATEVVKTVQSRRALYMAVLLHDIGKGRGGDHSEIGEQVALRLCPRVGLSPEETETVAWLVRYHLAMSNTAFRRDVNDPKTVSDFVGTVKSLERLRLLLVLTVADIRAVGPGVWNAWKAALLRDLYYAAEEAITGGMAAAGGGRRIEQAKAALASALEDFEPREIEAHLESGYPAYWLSHPTETHARHARLVRESRGSETPLRIDMRTDGYRQATEATVYAPDHPGLFSNIAGAIAVSGGNIVDAKIFTMADGMALDTFWVQGRRDAPIGDPDRLARLRTNIEQAVTGRMRPMREIEDMIRKEGERRDSVFTVEPRVIIDNAASATHTVVEVNGRDRPGLLYALTRALSAEDVQIGSAQIATYGESAVDVFYIKDLFGLKIEHEAKLERIRKALLEALSSIAAVAGETAGPTGHEAAAPAGP